jgi:hypothetical protein
MGEKKGIQVSFHACQINLVIFGAGMVTHRDESGNCESCQ